METTRKNLILAVETSIEGGSLAVFDLDEKIIVSGAIGKKEVSKAEDLLENLTFLLKESGIKKTEVAGVVFGTEIGSATGLKIGEASSKGLAKSLDCQYFECSFWDVFGKLASIDDSGKIFYLPAGRNKISVRQWNPKNTFSEIEFINFDDYPENLKKHQRLTIFVHGKIFNGQKASSDFRINNLGENLAHHLAKYASDNEIQISRSEIKFEEI